MADHHQLSNFIWQIADLLRGPYRPPQYERVMLPMTVLRRFDCVLASTKPQVLAKYESVKNNPNFQGEALERILDKASGQLFHNRSPLDFEKLKGDPNNIDQHLIDYIKGFSRNVREIFEKFEFTTEIEKMREANILYLIVAKFCDVDLHNITNEDMGTLFEDLIRRFNEAANETAGDHFTPREVIRLMVSILFDPDDDILTKPVVCKLLDPACGTGGMLAEAQNYLREHNSKARLSVFGQDFNPRAYAIAASDLLMKSSEESDTSKASDIRFGDSLINDQFTEDKFDYLIANPPFGVDWKKQQKEVVREHDRQGFAGRFGAGLPRVSDGSLLFLQHMISKFEPYKPEIRKFGSRLAIVFNGSPLFTGGAGSGESEIRKWVIKEDWLEAIIALPEQMFYNTGIGTYIWIVTNRKAKHRRGKVQLIDARTFYVPLRRSLGDKRRKLGERRLDDLDTSERRQEEPDHIGEIVRLYGEFQENEFSKIFANENFGYSRVPIERPLRLVYQMNVDRKSRFLDAVPHLLDDVQAIDKELGREPREDWSEFDKLMSKLLNQRGSKWKKPEYKLFRDVFTEKDPEAKRVILKERKARDDPHARIWGWFRVPDQKLERMYEPDSNLRDFENVRLVDIEDQDKNEKEIIDYFYKEVDPHVSDSWADKEKIRSAYEINFNRYFYKYTPPRSLAEIDADIRQMEEEIIRLLREVTA